MSGAKEAVFVVEDEKKSTIQNFQKLKKEYMRMYNTISAEKEYFGPKMKSKW